MLENSSGSRTDFGTWWRPEHPEIRVAGQLTQDGTKAPSLVLMNPPSSMWDLTPTQVEASVMTSSGLSSPVMHGSAAGRGPLTVLDASFKGHQTGQGGITIRLACGVVADGLHLLSGESKAFRRVELEVPSLAVVLGDSIDRLRPVEAASGIFKVKADDRRYQWRAGPIEVTWEYSWRASAGSTKFDLQMVPYITLTSPKPESVGFWVDQWVHPMMQFLQTVTGLPAKITKANAWRKKNISDVERARDKIPLLMRGVGPHEIDLSNANPIITPEAIDLNPDGIADVLRRTRALEDEQGVFLSLLSEISTSPDRPLRIRYLDLAVALEAYDSQLNGLGPIPEEHFKATKREIIARIKNAGVLETDEFKFAKRWLPGRSHYSLEARLNRVAKRVNLKRTGMKVAAKKLADIRNDIAHGSMETSGEELRQAYDEVYRLTRLAFLAEIGITQPTE